MTLTPSRPLEATAKKRIGLTRLALIYRAHIGDPVGKQRVSVEEMESAPAPWPGQGFFSWLCTIPVQFFDDSDDTERSAQKGGQNGDR